MPNVYVGQLVDIRHGAVYSNITEAVKEVCRAQKPGMVICFIYLPDTPNGKYWISGTIGPAANTKWNLIFTNSSDAEKHADSLIARGFPKSEVVCKELKIHTKGPEVIDIKTEEHFKVERELNAIKAALDVGIPYDNDSQTLRLTAEWEDGAIRLSYPGGEASILHLPSPGWTRPIDYHIAMETIQHASSLLRQLSLVDPETQPIKWERLRKQAATFDGTFEEPTNEG